MAHLSTPILGFVGVKNWLIPSSHTNSVACRHSMKASISSVVPTAGFAIGLRVQYVTYEVDVRFPGSHAISLTLSLWIPPGDGPFSVLLDGDGCWRYFNDQIIHSILQRSNIAASVDNSQRGKKQSHCHYGTLSRWQDRSSGGCYR